MIHVCIGCGGIGGHYINGLIRILFNRNNGNHYFKLVDGDVVEPKNISRHNLFYPSDYTEPKVNAIHKKLRKLSIYISPANSTMTKELADTYVIAHKYTPTVYHLMTDTAHSRRIIFEAIHDAYPVTTEFAWILNMGNEIDTATASIYHPAWEGTILDETALNPSWGLDPTEDHQSCANAITQTYEANMAAAMMGLRLFQTWLPNIENGRPTVENDTPARMSVDLTRIVDAYKEKRTK